MITDVVYEGIEYLPTYNPASSRPVREIWSLKIDDIHYVYYIYIVYHETILSRFKNYSDPLHPDNKVLNDIELPLDIDNPQATINKFYQLLMLQ
jgi:hypothetical protein